MLKNFKTYQKALELAWECKSLQLPYYLRDQLLRASSSVVLNLAEGSGRFSVKDQKRFYRIALGSVREVEAILDLQSREITTLKRLTYEVAAMLTKLSC